MIWCNDGGRETPMGAGHGQQLMTCRALHRNMHIQRACWEQSQDPATNSVMIHSPLGQNSKANLKDKEEFRFKNQYAGFPHFYELQTFPLDLLGLSLIILNLFFHLVLAYVRFRDPLWKIQPWLCLWSKKEKITLLHKQTLRSSDLNKSENWNESEFRQYLHKHHKLLRTQNEKCLHNGNIILPVVIRFHVSWPF